MITASLATLIVGATQSTSIDNYLPTGFKDITFNVAITKRNPNELKKIDTSYVQQYALDSAIIRAEDPLKLRFDAKSEETT
ncbi:MAG TPA: hypothetical protein VK171_14230, partial [Fimbriimonas sp.]|nr:hypothetical protein [Fimbriimonas sp.]